MPTVSIFYGIKINMYFGDHAHPHFHANYGNEEAVLQIRTLEVIRGKLPRRQMELVLEWAHLHREELEDNWRKVEQRDPLLAIAPLEKR